MPWTTPTLRSVRELVRGEIASALQGASFVGNSVLRVMADADAALAHLVLRYLDWQARQYLPDTAETEWLDRHGDIWLTNADGTRGRKVATLAKGTISLSGTPGFVMPIGTQFQSAANVLYETTDVAVFGSGPSTVPVIAIDPGAASNVAAGEPLAIVTALSGIDSTAIVLELTGGTDAESDQNLRIRILQRIQNPPMGGDADDYVLWALSVPGVTRAWCYPLEMGMGTVTVRFMCDELRADDEGFPWDEDVQAVTDYLNIMRPVAVKDFFVGGRRSGSELSFTVLDLVDDDRDRLAPLSSRQSATCASSIREVAWADYLRIVGERGDLLGGRRRPPHADNGQHAHALAGPPRGAGQHLL